jgi:hypothetical protein
LIQGKYEVYRMILSESDARQVLEVIRGQLGEIGAQVILDGIEESRRLGVEETLSDEDAKEMKQVGAMRRRPLSAVEELNIVLQRLEDRLVVLPRLAASIRDRLSSNEVEWRVDTDFVLESRIPEVSIARLVPEAHQEVTDRITEIMRAVEIPSTARVE